MSLAQFYTDDTVSDFLISQLDTESVANVLDIGCGESSLLLAAGRRWNEAELIGFDIDPRNIDNSNQGLQLHSGDALDPELSHKIVEKYGKIDIAVSNPPYIFTNYDSNAQEILRSVGLDQVISKQIRLIPAELIFLAQNLLVTKKEAELGFILPASLICGERWEGFREYITSELTIQSCIQLPDNAFKKTEATTFALCLKNSKSSNKKILLQHIDQEKKLEIETTAACARMDYDFHTPVGHNSSLAKLSKFPIEAIFRGNLTHNELRSSSLPYLHTSHINEQAEKVYTDTVTVPSRIKCASAGDILIARVGSRCHGRIAYIESGHLPISDCLFVIRSKHNREIWELITKYDLTNELRKRSLGVGAKYITRQILHGFFNADKLSSAARR